MVAIRAYQPEDLPALYEICLVTGNSGDDASADYTQPKLLGSLYSAPYGVLEPHNVFVAEDELGVSGYVVGTYDTDAFVDRQAKEWWPAIVAEYDGFDPELLTAADKQRLEAIRNPERNPADIVARYPAHVHMNLLARTRGQGVGSKLIQLWFEQARAAGVTSVHLGANAANAGGIAFWQKSGFAPTATIGRTLWMAQDIA